VECPLVSWMDRAISRGSVAGLAKTVAVVLLTFIVLVFVIQPCYAAPLSMRSHCCPSHAPKCHGSAPAEFCTMSSTGFALPEESRQAVCLDDEAPLQAVSTVSSAPARHQVSDSTWLPGRGTSLYSVLLV
jgi:hypothetical protein